MTPRPLHLGCLALAAVALSGCQSISVTANTTQIRVIVASPNAPGIDLYANGTPVAYNLAFGNVTSYVPMSPGAYIVSANSTGTRQLLTTAGSSFSGAAQYTVLLGDTPGNLQQSVLRDQSVPAPNGQVSIRILNQATAAGSVDVYLVPAGVSVTALAPVLPAQAFGTNSGYLNVSAGAYRILIYPAGATPTIPLHTGPLVSYPSGAARTLLLLDQKLTGGPVQVVTATDFDPPSGTN